MSANDLAPAAAAQAPGQEVAALRRCVRDLVALSTLPAAWGHAQPLGIVESLAEVVLRMLDLDLAYIRAPCASGALLEAGRTRKQAGMAGRGTALGRMLEAWIGFDGSEPPAAIPAPDGGAPLRLALLPVGHEENCGWLAAASRRSDFPSEHERLLLGVAVNQLAMALQRKAAEELLRESAASLADADRRKDEFLATLAHELRNPLAPLSAGLQLQRLAEGKRQLAAEALAMMERQLQHMVRLIDDLLDVSRISLGKIELRREWTELGAVVRGAVEAARSVIERAGHSVALELPDEPVYLNADAVRLAQVFGNLLNNAAKYTERGGTIALAVSRVEGQVEIAVRDNGTGIPPHLLTRVFDMFVQADPSLEKAHGGLGIGLTIVKRLVEMHGGTVEARSEGRGLGSEFIVRLPALEAAGARPSRQEAAPARRPAPARRILVVDDNADAASSLSMLLQAGGNEVRTAYDGMAAVEMAEAFRPEVILLDIGMGKLNGYDACRRIRNQPWASAAILIALSGWGQDEHKARAREAGFDHYLVKPVDTAALERLLAAGARKAEPGKIGA